VRKLGIAGVVSACAVAVLWGGQFLLGAAGFSLLFSYVVAITLYVCLLSMLIVIRPSIVGARREDLAMLVRFRS